MRTQPCGCFLCGRCEIIDRGARHHRVVAARHRLVLREAPDAFSVCASQIAARGFDAASGGVHQQRIGTRLALWHAHPNQVAPGKAASPTCIPSLVALLVPLESLGLVLCEAHLTILVTNSQVVHRPAMTSLGLTQRLRHLLLRLQLQLPRIHLVARESARGDHRADHVLDPQRRQQPRAHLQVRHRALVLLLEPLLDGRALVHVAVLRRDGVDGQREGDGADELGEGLVDRALGFPQLLPRLVLGLGSLAAALARHRDGGGNTPRAAQ
ncbi:hypothetical protein Ctob_010554, partial [Chrysochromulina tobinii]